MAERILQLAVAVAPELVGQREHGHRARQNGAVPPFVGVVDLQVKRHALGRDVLLNDEFPEYGGEQDIAPKGVTLHLQVDDADEWWNRAILAGAVPVFPLADQFWGDRYGQLKDPFGHSWSIGGPVKAT